MDTFVPLDGSHEGEIVEEFAAGDLALAASIHTVMDAYQSANKWLDTIKEDLLMDKGCVFFSSYIHNLAHQMPVRFDKFGDILHTKGITIPYPATKAYPGALTDVLSIINGVVDILDNIGEALRDFINTTTGTQYHSMASRAEELLIEVDGDVGTMLLLQKFYKCTTSNQMWDSYVSKFLDNKSQLV